MVTERWHNPITKSKVINIIIHENDLSNVSKSHIDMPTLLLSHIWCFKNNINNKPIRSQNKKNKNEIINEIIEKHKNNNKWKKHNNYTTSILSNDRKKNYNKKNEKTVLWGDDNIRIDLLIQKHKQFFCWVFQNDERIQSNHGYIIPNKVVLHIQLKPMYSDRGKNGEMHLQLINVYRKDQIKTYFENSYYNNTKFMKQLNIMDVKYFQPRNEIINSMALSTLSKYFMRNINNALYQKIDIDKQFDEKNPAFKSIQDFIFTNIMCIQYKKLNKFNKKYSKKDLLSGTRELINEEELKFFGLYKISMHIYKNLLEFNKNDIEKLRKNIVQEKIKLKQQKGKLKQQKEKKEKMINSKKNKELQDHLNELLRNTNNPFSNSK